MPSMQFDSTETMNAKGNSWWVTGLFIAADVAGAGLLAMSAAMVRAGQQHAFHDALF